MGLFALLFSVLMLIWLHWLVWRCFLDLFEGFGFAFLFDVLHAICVKIGCCLGGFVLLGWLWFTKFCFVCMCFYCLWFDYSVCLIWFLHCLAFVVTFWVWVSGFCFALTVDDELVAYWWFTLVFLFVDML